MSNSPHSLGPAKFTDEELAIRLDEVLKETDGVRSTAAQVMGISQSVVTRLIDQIPALHAKWGTKRDVPKDSVDVINRKPIARPLLPTSDAAVALADQEKVMESGLKNMGFKSKEIETIKSMENFAGESFEKTLTILHGGTVKSAMRLMMQAEEISDQYLQDDTLEPKEKRMWWDLYFRILENMRAQSEQAHKAALTRAIINSKKGGQAGTVSGKPGFATLISIQNNPKPEAKEPRKVN